MYESLQFIYNNCCIGRKNTTMRSFKIVIILIKIFFYLIIV